MARERAERRLAAILAADVAGYSRLMGADEEDTLARLKAHRRELIDPKIGEHRGRIVKTTGDGILVEFPSVVEAISCAVAVQREMAECNAGTPQDRRIAFRIGVNLGDIIVEDGDIHGDGVNIAARLEGIAEPGGICVSEDAFRQVRGKVDAEFDDLGEQSLKNITRPLRVFCVRPASAADWPVTGLPLPDKPSLAVLPLQNLSGDPEQEYFADVNPHAELDALRRWHGLVAGRHLALHVDRATHRVDNASELDQEAVAGGLDDASAMLTDFRIDQLAPMRLEPREGIFLVGAHEPAVARHVRGENGRQPAFGAFRGQSGLPRTAWAEELSALLSILPPKG